MSATYKDIGISNEAPALRELNLYHGKSKTAPSPLQESQSGKMDASP